MGMPAEVDARALRRAFKVAEAWLLLNRDGINAINVYPVPDGDTGTNMLFTWRAALEATTEAETGVGAFLAELSHGALLGARGNGGVILSQMLRGLSESLAGARSLDARGLADALLSASRVAYEAMSNPVEGTMLTVMREAANAGEAVARAEGPLELLLERVVEEAYASVERTPELLPRLREAGVVDAGGMGVAVLLHGIRCGLRDEPLPETPVVTGQEHVTLSSAAHEGEGYCTEFIIEGANLDRATIESSLTGIGGESVLVVGDARTVHVHVHMENPGPAITVGAEYGALASVKVENMQTQYEQWAAARTGAEQAVDPASLPALGLVAVARGAGFAAAFHQLGAGQVITGDGTGKASAGELLEAARRAGRDHVILLPNDRDVLMAAARAAEASDGFVSVVPTRSMAAGLAAAIAYMPDGDPATIVAAMESAIHAVQSIEVTTSVRDATIDGIEIAKGDAIVFVNERLIGKADDLDDALLIGLREARTHEAELVTLYRGEGADAEAGARVAARIAEEFPDVVLEVIEGGQPHYPYMAGVE